MFCPEILREKISLIFMTRLVRTEYEIPLAPLWQSGVGRISHENQRRNNMLANLGSYLQNKRYGVKALSAVAVSLFCTGLLVSSGMNWTTPAVAENPVTAVTGGAEQTAAISPFTALAKQLTPAVVNIRVNKIEKAGFPFPNMPEGPFGGFFNHPQMPDKRPVQGAGSGVIINADGTILTNNHVVEGAKEVTVTLGDKRELKAEIVGRDPKTDLAVLKIDAGKNLPFANLGNSDQLQVGDWVLAVGNPFGLSSTVTSGIVSAKGRVIGAGPYDDFIQTDASINPGNSGGPLFNMGGEIVGINTAIISGGQGIGFAIPVNTAKPLIPQMVEKGKVTRGYLGVNIQTVTPELAEALKLGDVRGTLVADVVSGGPAEKAGIKRGDVIVGFEGKPVRDSHELPALVAATPVGKEVTVTVVREGNEQQLHAKLVAMEGDELASNDPRQPAQGKWGLQLQDLNPQLAKQLGLDTDQGAVIVGVQPGSPADEAAIQKGEVIVEVNREPVKSVKEVKDAIAKAGDKNTLLLLVQGEKGKHYIVLKG
jgi:serine protease Do